MTLVKNFGVFFLWQNIYKGHFYVLPPPGSVGKSVALWWDSEPPIIIPKLAKSIGFWKIDSSTANYHDFFQLIKLPIEMVIL